MLTLVTLLTSLAAANAPTETVPTTENTQTTTSQSLVPQAPEPPSVSWRLRERALTLPETETPYPGKRGQVITVGMDRGVVSLYLLTEDGGFVCGGPAENCLNIMENQNVFMMPHVNMCEVSGQNRMVDFYYDFMNTGKTRACQVLYCMPTGLNHSCTIEDMQPFDGNFRY